MTQTLIMTVGLPRSGKSTWARARSYPIVNPDSIRLALHGQRYQAEAEGFVWAICKVMVKSLFLAGHSTVVLDATNTTRKARDSWLSESWERQFQVIDTSKEDCIKRALTISDTYIIPVIERMAEQFEPLQDDEFDKEILSEL